MHRLHGFAGTVKPHHFPRWCKLPASVVFDRQHQTIYTLKIVLLASSSIHLGFGTWDLCWIATSSEERPVYAKYQVGCWPQILGSWQVDLNQNGYSHCSVCHMQPYDRKENLLRSASTLPKLSTIYSLDLPPKSGSMQVNYEKLGLWRFGHEANSGRLHEVVHDWALTTQLVLLFGNLTRTCQVGFSTLSGSPSPDSTVFNSTGSAALISARL